MSDEQYYNNQPIIYCDEVSPTELYFGTSVNGENINASYWKIQRYKKFGNVWHFDFPDYNQGFNFIWNDRFDYTYTLKSPTNLSANQITLSQIDLTWSNPNTDYQYVYVESSVDGINYSVIFTGTTGITTYSNTGLTLNTTYYYRVRVKNGLEYSHYSNIVSILIIIISKPFIFRIYGQTMTIPQLEGLVYNYSVDWGDGSSSIVTSWDDPNSEHIYSEEANYDISISGTCESFMVFGYLQITDIISWGQVGFKSVSFNDASQLSSIPEDVYGGLTLVTDFNYCFVGTAITEIPSGLFSYCINATNFSYCFNGCYVIDTIPSGLFSGCINATNFSYCFNGTGITEIPSGLFSGCINATDFSYCFVGTGITEIPSGLFSGCINATNFSYCFNGTGITEIPSGLFSGCINATDFSYCFVGTGITEIPSGLFSGCINATNFTFCFSNCIALTEISSGLFDDCINATTFTSCFYECENLSIMPDNLFSNCINATDFSVCFYRCYALTTTGNYTFSNCVNVTDFSACFGECNSLTTIGKYCFYNLTGITSFGIGTLFPNCPDLVNVDDYAFYNCINAAPTNIFGSAQLERIGKYAFGNWLKITSVPNLTTIGLNKVTITTIDDNAFDGCSKLTSLAGAWNGKTNLVTIGNNVFNNCTGITTTSTAFQGCTALTSVGDEIFSNCTKITTFLNVFNNCTALATVGKDLFKNCIVGVNFTTAFQNCNKLQLHPEIFCLTGETGTKFLNKSPNFTSVFKRTSFTGVQGTAPDLWNYNYGTGTATKTTAFNGAGNSLTSLTNYASIPVAWI